MARRPNYFRTDCLDIVRSAQAGPDEWARVATFTILTIRQMFILMPAQMADVDSNGAAARCLFAWKSDAYRHIHANKAALWRAARQCKRGRTDLDSLILDYLAIPGLGIVKASFLAQMTVGDGACLDSHNLRTLGLSKTAFRTPKTLKTDTVRARIHAYNAVWRAVGDSSHWWQLWCDGMAARRPLWFATGADCSRMHRLAILAESTADREAA